MLAGSKIMIIQVISTRSYAKKNKKLFIFLVVLDSSPMIVNIITARELYDR